MSKPLSVSAYNLYMECPAKYDLQKNKRLYPTTSMSYFAFGSAVDKALNALLLSDGDPYAIGNEELKRLVDEPTEFLEADYDAELLSDEQKAQLLVDCRATGYPGDNVDGLAAALLSKPYAELSENQRKALALCCTASLREKARLMIDAYKSKVVPHIEKVNSVQREIKWVDEFGNEFIGFLDLELEYRGQGSVIADNKTSSNPFRDYGPDCVRQSFQLATYAHVVGNSQAGYIVMDKAIKKNRVKTCMECGHISSGAHKTCNAEPEGTRCGGEWTHTIRPEVAITTRFDEIPTHQVRISQEALSGVANAVRANIYPKNLKACRVQYGKKEIKCPYYEYCRKGTLEGLQVKAKT